MRKFAFLLLLIVSGSVSANNYPTLLDVVIGQPFGHPNATANKDAGRPTTQYRVPNYGESEAIFSEYQIASINNTDAVVIVTGEAATASLSECNRLKEKAAQIIRVKFPNYVNTPISKSQLNGSREYSKEGANTYYVLSCQGTYGPFTYLHFQMRGIEEDRQLKAAWSKFFGKKR